MERSRLRRMTLRGVIGGCIGALASLVVHPHTYQWIAGAIAGIFWTINAVDLCLLLKMRKRSIFWFGMFDAALRYPCTYTAFFGPHLSVLLTLVPICIVYECFSPRDRDITKEDEAAYAATLSSPKPSSQ